MEVFLNKGNAPQLPMNERSTAEERRPALPITSRNEASMTTTKIGNLKPQSAPSLVPQVGSEILLSSTRQVEQQVHLKKMV